MILSIETSTSVCSAALHDDGKLVAFEITHTPNSAAGQLAVMVDKLLKQPAPAVAESDGGSVKLQAVAVSSGPGSYTGLRIGIATAKGICYALSLPLIAVNSLEVMARQVTAEALMCPMIDARRMEVYTMLLDKDFNVIEPVSASVIDSSSYAERLRDHRIIFFGNGSDKCKPVISHPNAVFIDDIFPSAEWMGGMAYSRFRENRFEDIADFEPAYLKDFIAKKPKSLV
jgi:tRNA threonylcarbamoyladenosine biosynthesis protein TsaB